MRNKEERLAELIRRAKGLNTGVPNLIAHWEKILLGSPKGGTPLPFPETQKPAELVFMGAESGAAVGSRTPNLLIRSQTLRKSASKSLHEMPFHPHLPAKKGFSGRHACCHDAWKRVTVDWFQKRHIIPWRTFCQDNSYPLTLNTAKLGHSLRFRGRLSRPFKWPEHILRRHILPAMYCRRFVSGTWSIS